MKKANYNVLGLMSGTSLDGLDIAFCTISVNQGIWQYQIKQCITIAYDASFKNELKLAIQLPAIALLDLHNKYGIWLGHEADKFIKENDLKVDFIASHGHTIHHLPSQGITFQIGSGQHLANISDHQVICDFRSNDVALGGQGAPLVPIGDALFFKDYDFCLNLGGISNISFDLDGNRIAYDIGIANMLLNYLTQKEGISYDDKGQMARSGNLNSKLLSELNALDYYKKPYPKSTGIEWFEHEIVPILRSNRDSFNNSLHTAIHHICDTIAIDIKKYAFKKKNTLLVTGGGALNDFMMELLQDKLGDNINLQLPSKIIIDYKEALIFALMGVLRERREINTLSSVTGASTNSVGGVIFYPSN